MIGDLHYLTHTSPYFSSVIRIIERYQEYPKEMHLAIVKRIFKYLKGTLEFGLQYDRSNDFTLYAYIDPDWEGI